MIRAETLQAQRHRLAELSALRRELTDEEVCELVGLDRLERRRGAQRHWRAANAESERRRTAEWRQSNPQRCRDQHSTWRQANREAYGVARPY